MSRTPEQFAELRAYRKRKVQLAERLSFDLMEKLNNAAIELFARRGLEDVMLEAVQTFDRKEPYTQQELEQLMKAAIQKKVDILIQHKEKQHP